jgi:hypothetical protein
MIKPISKNVELGGQITTDAIDEAMWVYTHAGGNTSDFQNAMDLFGCDLVHPKYGKITKRLAKHTKKHYDFVIPDDVLSRIGKIFSESAVTKKLHVSILGDTCFTPGIFGDGDACFFKQKYTYYRQSIEALEGKGVCFFEGGMPLARCWLIKNPQENNYITFNLYVAYRMSLSLRQAAEALLQVLDMNYCKSMYWGTGNIYVNNNRIFVLSENKLTRTTYNMEQPYISDRYAYSCRDCGEILLPDSDECGFCGRNQQLVCNHCGEYINLGDERHVNDDVYCEECYDEYFFHCDSCGDIVDRDSEYYVEDCGSYCEHCYHRKFTRCECCDSDVYRDDIYYVRNSYGDEIIVCEECRDNYFLYCDKCEEYYHEDVMKEFDDTYMCRECFTMYVVTCRECGNDMWRKDAQEPDAEGNYLCGDCYEEEQEKEDKNTENVEKEAA